MHYQIRDEISDLPIISYNKYSTDTSCAFQVFCARYIGRVTATKHVSKEAPVSAASVVVFKWHMQTHGQSQTAYVQERANIIKGSAVPLPCPWRAALHMEATYAAMHDTAKLFCRGCTFTFWLGSPKKISLPVAAGLFPGKTLMVMCPSGQRIEHILCARVCGHLWYCHPGTSSLTNPFDPRDLVVYNVHQRAWRPQSYARQRRIRLRGRCQKRGLGIVALRVRPSFEWAVAVAMWRAEAMRSVDYGDQFDLHRAMAGIDIDVLDTGFGKMVAAAWQWQDSRDGSVHHEMCGEPSRLLRVSPDRFLPRAMRSCR